MGRHRLLREVSGAGGLRVCCQCDIPKPPEEYNVNARNWLGRDYRCKDCRSAERRRATDAMIAGIDARTSPTMPLNLTCLIDRSERRADLAEIGGLEGVHEIRRRIRAAGRAKAMLDGAEVPAGMIEELC